MLVEVAGLPMDKRLPDHIYRPFEGTPQAMGVYALVALSFLLDSLWPTTDWMPWAPRWVPHIFTVVVLAAFPVVAMSMGWSYALVANELLVFRFNKERYRLPLSTYERTTVDAGVPRLHFRERKIWLVSGIDAPRQEFLAELHRRAHSATGTTKERVRHLDHERVRLHIADLRFPKGCVACRANAEHTTRLTVQRGYDVLLAAHFQSVDVRVPTCEKHAAQRGRATWQAWMLLAPLIGLIAGVLMATIPGGVWSGALFVGALIALIIFRPLQTMVGRQYLDWLILGIRASNLSADLTEVTLRIRDHEVAREVIAHAGRSRRE